MPAQSPGMRALFLFFMLSIVSRLVRAQLVKSAGRIFSVHELEPLPGRLPGRLSIVHEPGRPTSAVVLCCAVLCCAVLCCVVLCCVVLCCVVLCCVVLCCVVLCCVVLCCVVLCCAVLCCVVLCCAVLCRRARPGACRPLRALASPMAIPRPSEVYGHAGACPRPSTAAGVATWSTRYPWKSAM